MVVVDKTHKPMEGCLIVIGDWKSSNCFDTRNVRTSTVCTDCVAQEVHFSLPSSHFAGLTTSPWSANC